MRSIAAVFAAVTLALSMSLGVGAQSVAPYAQTNSGTLSAVNQQVVVRNLNSATSTCTTTVSGTGSGTLVFEGSNNSPTTTFQPVADTGTYNAVPTFSSSSTAVTSATGPGLFYSEVPGLVSFRVRMSAFSSGTLSVSVACGVGDFAPQSSGGSGGGGGTYTAPPLQNVSFNGTPQPVTVTNGGTYTAPPTQVVVPNASQSPFNVHSVDPTPTPVPTTGAPVAVQNIISTVGNGCGPDTAFPTSVSTSGTSLGSAPVVCTNPKGIEIDIPQSAGGTCSVSFYVATSQSGSAVAVSHTETNPSTSQYLPVQISLVAGEQVWVTNVVSCASTTFISGLPTFRWN